MRKYLQLLRITLLLMIQLTLQVENSTLNFILLGLWRLCGQDELVWIFYSNGV